MPYNKTISGSSKYIVGAKKKKSSSVSNKIREKATAMVKEAFTIFLASSLFLPSITAMSNFAFATSIKINTIEENIPNSANSPGEKYFGNTSENKKLMTCTNANPMKSAENFLNIEVMLTDELIFAKLRYYSFALV